MTWNLKAWCLVDYQQWVKNVESIYHFLKKSAFLSRLKLMTNGRFSPYGFLQLYQ